MDFTCIQILWLTFTVAAIMDGFSRRILALRVYRQSPRTSDALRLVRRTVRKYGKPQFLITDHGGQFRKRFRTQLKGCLHIHHVGGRVRAPYLNGKIERAFWTLKFWWRCVLAGRTTRSIQHRLDDYQHWYNHYRIHSACGVLTPDETWSGATPPVPIPIRACNVDRIHIDIRRLRCRGDPRLRVLQIGVLRPAA